MSINCPGPGSFPLTPGRPLVFRCRRRGAWGFACQCLDHSNGSAKAISSEQPNCDNWADALHAARTHVRYWHKSPAEVETELLERMYAAPSAIGSTS